MMSGGDLRAPFLALPKKGFEALSSLPSPSFLLSDEKLRENGKVLREVADKSGCKILLAQKAFSNYDLYPVLAPFLAGTEASGLYEARLGKEEMPGKEVHVFSAAYKDEEFDELLLYADHIVFNSPGQLRKFGATAKAAGKSIGLRLNPECSTQEGHDIYDPCAPGSRLGTTRAAWDAEMTEDLISLLDGLHFHTLCEQDSDALLITVQAFEQKFSDIIKGLKWINFGGGHHITRPGYNLSLLVTIIKSFREKWNTEVYLEPGEACALNAGFLITRVLDVKRNGAVNLAILDMSAACHTPDVLEMPYRPPLYMAGDPSQYPFTYRLCGPTCLSGDVIGDYSFNEPLQEKDLLIFGDMAIYTTCKTNTFNGMPLPSIYRMKENNSFECLASFSYQDFKQRLGK